MVVTTTDLSTRITTQQGSPLDLQALSIQLMVDIFMLTSQRPTMTLNQRTETPHPTPTILSLITSLAPAILTTSLMVNQKIVLDQITCTLTMMAIITHGTTTHFPVIQHLILITIANRVTVNMVKNIATNNLNNDHHSEMVLLKLESLSVKYVTTLTLMMVITTLTLNHPTHLPVAVADLVTPTLILMIPTPQMMDLSVPPMTTRTTPTVLTTMASSQTTTTSILQVMIIMVHLTTTDMVPRSVTCTSATNLHTTSRVAQDIKTLTVRTQVQLEDLEFEIKERVLS